MERTGETKKTVLKGLLIFEHKQAALIKSVRHYF